MKQALVMLFCAAVTGCVAMDETACRNANWSELGKRDGLTGLPPRIDQYAYQCSQHNVAAAEKDYMDGWWIGNDEHVRRNPGTEGP